MEPKTFRAPKPQDIVRYRTSDGAWVPATVSLVINPEVVNVTVHKLGGGYHYETSVRRGGDVGRWDYVSYDD